MVADSFNFIGQAFPRAHIKDGFLVGGPGRPWVGYTAIAAWRTLADIALRPQEERPKRIVDFVQQIGLPILGHDLTNEPLRLDKSDPAMKRLNTLILTLAMMAMAWEPRDDPGISRFQFTDEKVPNKPPQLKEGPDVDEGWHVGELRYGRQGLFGTPGIYLAVSSLPEYLMASATIHIERGQVFARCRQCLNWFTPQKPNKALFCSPKCRVIAHAASKRKTA